MAAYDLTGHHKGAVSQGDLVFSAVTPRALRLLGGEARTLDAPAAPYVVDLTADGVSIGSVDVAADGTATLSLPEGGVQVAAGSRIKGVAGAGASGGDVLVSISCEDESPASYVYDVASFGAAAAEPDAGGLVAALVAVRGFSATSVRVSRLDGQSVPLMVVVSVLSGSGTETSSWAVSTSGAAARLNAPISAAPGDAVRVFLYGRDAATVRAAVTLFASTDALGASLPVVSGPFSTGGRTLFAAALSVGGPVSVVYAVSPGGRAATAPPSTVVGPVSFSGAVSPGGRTVTSLPPGPTGTASETTYGGDALS